MKSLKADAYATQPFKRSELKTPKLKFLFFGFATLTACIILFFLFEDYQIAIHYKLMDRGAITLDLFGQSTQSDTGIPTSHIVSWVVAAFLLFIAFSKKVGVLFKLLACICIGIILAYNFWDILIISTIAHPESSMARMTQDMTFPMGVKIPLLVIWGYFGFHLAIALAYAKYAGIFNRLNHLFDSIAHGNWDAIMFFRNEDSFQYVAKTFNTLKDKYLERIYAMDDTLIAAKDLLAEPDIDRERCRAFLDEHASVSNKLDPQPES